MVRRPIYYHAIIDGLRELGLRPDVSENRKVRWRWVGTHRSVTLQVEFLCPARGRAGRPEDPAVGTPAETNIGQSGEITALAIGYGHLVPEDTVTVERWVTAVCGALSFEFPVAGLASWLALKADAIMLRNKPKDAYDVVWTLDALGPVEAAERVAATPLLATPYAHDVRSQLARLLTDQFRDRDSIGPRAYAAFLDVAPGERERRHAQGTAVAFGRELGRCGLNI